MLESLLQTGYLQNLLRYLCWILITGIFLSGAFVYLQSHLKRGWLKKVSYFFSFAGPVMLFLMILGGSVEFGSADEGTPLRFSSISSDAFQAHPIMSQVIEKTYVFGCWTLLGGSFCSGFLMLIKRRLPHLKILIVSYAFSLLGPILLIFLVWNRSLVLDDMEISGLNASWYQKAAEKGNSWAQVELGQCYLEGRGVMKKEDEAFRLFKKAAEQGYAAGQRALARCYQEGVGVTKDERMAFEWYSRAAKQGDAYGQTSLGWFFLKGIGIAKDEKKAFEWFNKSAMKGDSDGQYMLGRCFLFGKGVEKDEKKAFEWFTKSAAQGDVDGQNVLGWCYRKGVGVSKDERKAFEWYAMYGRQHPIQHLCGGHYPCNQDCLPYPPD